jgi:hypothetical protein
MEYAGRLAGLPPAAPHNASEKLLALGRALEDVSKELAIQRDVEGVSVEGRRGPK